MRVSVFIALLSLLVHGCLMHDDTSKRKVAVASDPWEGEESEKVKKEANFMADSCIFFGAWQSYGNIDKYVVKHVNWTGEMKVRKGRMQPEMIPINDAHHYVKTTRPDEGEPVCELKIWINSAAVDYMKHHNIQCWTPDSGKVFFKMRFPYNDLTFKRSKAGDCEDNLFFLRGKEDGSLTMVTGKDSDYEGKLFSANQNGELKLEEEKSTFSTPLVTYNEDD